MNAKNLSGHLEYKAVEKKMAKLNREHFEFIQNKQFKEQGCNEDFLR